LGGALGVEAIAAGLGGVLGVEAIAAGLGGVLGVEAIAAGLGGALGVEAIAAGLELAACSESSARSIPGAMHACTASGRCRSGCSSPDLFSPSNDNDARGLCLVGAAAREARW